MTLEKLIDTIVDPSNRHLRMHFVMTDEEARKRVIEEGVEFSSTFDCSLKDIKEDRGLGHTILTKVRDRLTDLEMDLMFGLVKTDTRKTIGKRLELDIDAGLVIGHTFARGTDLHNAPFEASGIRLVVEFGVGSTKPLLVTMYPIPTRKEMEGLKKARVARKSA